MMTLKRSIELSSRRFVAVAMLAAVLATGCHPANSARGVVDRFIHEYYVVISLKGTEQYCTGLALEKVRHEMLLTAGQKIDAATRKPTVHYKLKAQREQTDHTEFLFAATIDVPDGGGQFKRNWMITARKDGQTWKVSNFSEY